MAGKWHVLSRQEVLEKLNSHPKDGLDAREAKQRFEQLGPNRLVSVTKTPPLVMFLNQFKDFMVMVLIVATIISGFLQEWADAITIMIIVVINAILGFAQEFRAEKSMEALKRLTAPEARVIRNGLETKIPAEKLVPGDIVLLETGDKVPADLRLLEAINLQVEESALTGESTPVKKQVEKMSAQEHVSLGDTHNMAYMGTVVVRGRAKGIVVATGMATEMGHIAGMMQEVGEKQTPLQRRLAHLGKVLVAFCLAICALVVLLGVYRGEPVYQMFLAGVSLAVAAIPEGLPAIVTIALAIGVQRMVKRNAIIRRLPAVETLGCATVICSDKTGTLTQNKMTVRRIVTPAAEIEVSGEGYDPKGEFNFIKGKDEKGLDLLLKTAALCNNAVLTKGNITVGGLLRRLTKRMDWDINGDPTEGALLVMAAKGGMWRQHIEKKERRIAELPFDSDRKRMSVIYREPGGKCTAYVKGAPDVVLELCTHYYQDGKLIPLNANIRQSILRQNAKMAESALRVLAFAVRDLPDKDTDYTEQKVEKNLVFLGLAGMIDPPRPEALRAIYTCQRAGIKTVMITGDHQLTAQAIGRELGLLHSSDGLLTGAELDAMNDKTLRQRAKNVTVYARVSPKHKLRIVRALKANGHVVAMTGDGVNDAPAVKEADIGIAMGKTGTDVTKEASSMILADDNFQTIVNAVEEGRGIYDNIRKFIRYLLSCNVGEVLVMFLAVLGGLPLPLVPIQILWVNLVTDGLPAMALGVDPADRDIMSRPPRHPQESIFAHGLGWKIIYSGTIIAFGTLLAFCLGLSWGSEELARTMAFNTLVLFQLFYVFVCRSEHHSLLEIGLLSNPYLLVAVGISAALQLTVNYLPFLQPIFKTVPLGPLHWAVILAITLTPTLLGIVIKDLKRRMERRVSYIKV